MAAFVDDDAIICVQPGRLGQGRVWLDTDANNDEVGSDHAPVHSLNGIHATFAAERTEFRGQLHARRPRGAIGDILLFLDLLPSEDPDFGGDVPDPYYGGMTDYELSLDLIERGMPGLIDRLKR